MQREDAPTLRLLERQADENAAKLPLVFVLPGLGGEDDPKLASLWVPARSVFDLFPVAYLDWTEIYAAGCDFSVLAHHVRRQIEERVPEGPIRLAGYSIGGHLAYLTALELQNEGRMVESVVIFDAPVRMGDYKPGLAERLRQRFEQVITFNLLGATASLIAKTISRQRFRPWLGRIAPHRRKPLPFRFETFLHHKITMQLVRRIFPEWWQRRLLHANPLQVTTFLFRSEEHNPSESEDLGWLQYCANLRVVRVKGSHRGMLDPPNNALLCAAFIEAVNSVRDGVPAVLPSVLQEHTGEG